MSNSEQQSFAERQILEQRARELAKSPEQDRVEESINTMVVELDDERYGLPISDINEIRPLDSFTPIPGVSSLWLGLFNLRSTLIPLLDLRVYLGLKPFPFNSKQTDEKVRKNSGYQKGQIIIVQKEDNLVGLLVDLVSEVKTIPLSKINAPLETISKKQKNVVRGLTSELITILDIQKLLEDPDLIIN
ncbi:chemotaxis protein CheW [Pelolinea submarina]|uniref:CheW protein n=1 Tax=Pelolinea submarina TaxID=913107 RepID=A0A347ZU11_9CHLR|nr:chemotaxis protein CheW [Pelolinea submarina]REG10624.1 CheW protein [Pelolinea submarina]BBB48792.1 purine-binding chemotaxis protein CheW [Pelolinea submarina]